MTSCCAAIFRGQAGEIELAQQELPRLRTGETLVRVLGCTLCGSDLHSFHGRRSVPVPTILGHEIAGQIVARDAAAPAHDLAGRALELGDRVVWSIVAECGECFFCERNLPQKCLRAVKYGHEAISPGRELLGGLADHCVLARNTSLVRLPPELSLSAACPASCATATVVAAFEAAGELQRRSVCIVGAGMLGLTACAMAQSHGAAVVVAVDPVQDRRELALQFGATLATTPLELDASTRTVRGPHGFDVVLEFSGNPAGFEQTWPLLRIGGTLVAVGAVYPAPPVSLSLESVVRRQLTIRGVHNYAPRHLAQAVDFLAESADRFPLGDLVAEWFPLSSIAAAFRQAGESGAIRIGVYPDAVGAPAGH